MIEQIEVDNGVYQEFKYEYTPTKEEVAFTLRFLPLVEEWTLSISYKSRIVQNIKVVQSIDLLNAYSGYFPFSIAVTREDNLDPFYRTAFEDTQFYIYSIDEYDSIALQFFGS